jgi:hypothetical protein
MQMRQILMVGLLAGCVPADPTAGFSSARIYPVGPDQFMVTCVDGSRNCAAQLPKICPKGSDVTSMTANPADFGRITMMVNCRKA